MLDGVGVGRKLDLLDLQRGFAEDDLNRLRHCFPEEDGTKDIMPVDHSLHGPQVAIELFSGLESSNTAQYVRVCLISQEEVEEDALLEGSEGIDILHVGYTARRLKEEMVDLSLGEFEQGQHLRRDVLCVLRDEIRWKRDLLLRPQGGGELSEGGCLKEASDIGLESVLSHAFNERDGEQGVSAELEEVVESSDAIDMEQLLPQAGEQDLGFALWGLEGGGGEGIAARSGQGLTIELAVGGQR